MKKLISLSAIIASVLLSGCATIFLPSAQKVTLTTDADAKLIADSVEFGSGPQAKGKIEKGDPVQIIVRKEGYKDNFEALVPTHISVPYCLLQPLNVPTFLIGFVIDGYFGRKREFDKTYHIPLGQQLPTRKSDEKYIYISNVTTNFKDPKKDVARYTIKQRPGDLAPQIAKAEKANAAALQKAEAKRKKDEAAGIKEKEVLDKPKEVTYENALFTQDIFKTLKKTGYVDTVNRIFEDNNNSLILEGKITGLHYYNIYGNTGGFFLPSERAKIMITWYIENSYYEVLDSIQTTEWSGSFVGDSKMKMEKVVGDAVSISYLKLYNSGALNKYIKQQTNLKIDDAVLTINNENQSYVTDKSDAAGACVIVKTKDGHGSGFAVSSDGYIITNYHVVTGRLGPDSSYKVILADGSEADAKVVRINKFRDLALLKIENKFEKCFKITNTKSYKTMLPIYTIGTPKSIELGQSISAGLISNERKNNNNDLLQLNMSINSGNSGGPVFDDKCTLHGVVVGKLIGKNTEGVSFAIPGYLIQDYLNLKFE